MKNWPFFAIFWITLDHFSNTLDHPVWPGAKELKTAF